MPTRTAYLQFAALALAMTLPQIAGAADGSAPASGVPPVAAAPISASAPSQDAGRHREYELEEVIVTATRREVQVSDVPASIVALGEQALAVSGAHNIDDIAALVPGLDFGRSAFGGQISYISFRGLSTVAGASTVGVYIDDTAVQGRINPNAFSFFGNAYPVTFDLNRVEALRGPQGTLFGAGAEGGAVRLIFNKPDLEKVSGLARTEVSNTESGGLSYEAGAAYGGPLVEGSTAFRASAFQRVDGGYIDHVDPFTGAVTDANFDQATTKAYRLALTQAFGPKVTITPAIMYQSTDTDNPGVMQAFTSDPTTATFQNYKLLEQPSSDAFYVASINADADLGWAKLSSATANFARDAKSLVDVTSLYGAFGPGYGNPRGPEFPSAYSDAGRQPTTTKQQVVSQEIRLASNAAHAPLQWIGGVFFSRGRQDEDTSTFSPAIAAQNGEPADANLLYIGTRTVDTQYALFGEVDWRLSPELTATLGLRVAHYESDFTQFATGIFNGGVPPVFTGSIKETPVTPRTTLSYRPDDSNLFYATVSRGFRMGGSNSGLPDYCNGNTPLTYDSDSVWNYEVGSKNDLMDGRVRLEASLYRLKWKNLQENVFLPCGFGVNLNAGDATSTGVELGVQAFVTKNLQLSLSAAYNNSKHSEDYFFGPDLVVRDGQSVGAVPQVPTPWMINSSARYEFMLTESYRGYVWIEDTYHSSNHGPFNVHDPASLAYFPDLVANPDTNEINMRVALTWSRFEASLFVNNLTDGHPLLYKSVDVPGMGIENYSSLRPRTIGVNLDYHF